MSTLKQHVHDFWDSASCGEVYADGGTLRQRFQAHAATRYSLEPYIEQFARFHEGRDRDVLEIGVGMGADHVRWAQQSPRHLVGIDLTARAIDWTSRRIQSAGLSSQLQVADAERLPFEDESFDLVYSWGVLHHSPDTPQAVREVYRVLRPGGTAKVMIYHRRSIVGALLWLRYGLVAGCPRRSLDDLYAAHLESPGTKAYSVDEAFAMFGEFGSVKVRPQVGLGDLLMGEVGQQHTGRLLKIAKKCWPRAAITKYADRWGLMLLIEARKPW